MYVISALFETWTDILVYIEEVEEEYELYKVKMEYEIFYLIIEDIYKVKIKVCN